MQVDALGETTLHWTCGTAGLGGIPYRDGSYEYYVTEKVVTNDPKGVAAFILAAVEMEAGGWGESRESGRCLFWPVSDERG